MNNYRKLVLRYRTITKWELILTWSKYHGIINRFKSKKLRFSSLKKTILPLKSTVNPGLKKF